MSHRERSPRGRRLRLLSLVVAGSAIASCGDDTSTIAKKVDACTLLKGEEVQRVIGATFRPAEPGRTAGGGENQGYMSSCTFATPEPSIDELSLAQMRAAQQKGVFVTVMVWSWPPAGKGADNYMAAIAKVKEMPARSVSGIGETALWNGGLHVKRGHVNLIVDMNRHKSVASAADDIKMETALAKIALARLPE